LLENNIDITLITGGTGFFGRALLRLLNQNDSLLPNKNIVVLSRNPDRFLDSYPEFSNLRWLKFYQADILDDLNGLKFNGNIVNIIHAAADSTEGPKLKPIDRYKQIVNGTENILDLAIKHKIENFLYVSSGAVYGDQPNDLDFIPEDYLGGPNPLGGDSTYGLSKKMAEHLCVLYAEQYHFKVVIARCFAFVGPDLPLSVHFAIGNFIRDAIENNKINVNGDGSPLRSYLYQDDLAEWLIKILILGKNREVYNVGSDQSISILKLANLVKETIAPKKNISIKNIISSDESKRNIYIPNIDKAKNILNLEIKTDLKTAIRLTADHYMSRLN
jgi:UDP-glucuronate decarboxylase